MAKNQLLRLLIAAVAAAALLLNTAEAGGDFSWIPVSTPSTCQGSIAECMAEGSGGEFEMDSESNRRILATTKYISYGALQANNVPCSRRGASYYNCQPGAEANPYSRSCTAATQCRSQFNYFLFLFFLFLCLAFSTYMFIEKVKIDVINRFFAFERSLCILYVYLFPISDFFFPYVRLWSTHEYKQEL